MPCMYHPLVTTDLTPCAVCGHAFCGDCLADFQGRRMCAPCKNEAVARMEMGQEAAPGAGEKAPWERRAELGVITAWWQTVKAVLGRPGEFFERLDKEETSAACLFVPIINQTLVAISQAAWGLAFAGVLSSLSGPAKQFAAMFVAQGVMGVVVVVLAPIGALFGVVMGAGLTHLALLATKNARCSFQQTMRGWCYASCPGVLGVIPIIGGLAGIWTIVVDIIMVMKMHRTSGGMAALAVLWWLALLICCAAGLMIMGFGLLAAAGKH